MHYSYIQTYVFEVLFWSAELTEAHEVTNIFAEFYLL